MGSSEGHLGDVDIYGKMELKRRLIGMGYECMDYIHSGTVG
jgi:hypothetical protein